MSLGDAKRRAPGRSAAWVVFGWTLPGLVVRWMFRIVYGVRASAAGTVPARGPLIFVANHQSHLDPPLVGSVVLDRPCAFLARASLFRFRPFGMMIRFFNAVPIEREGRGTSAMRAALAELDAGRCVLVFPEGTRSPDGELRRFKPGFLLLVKKTGAAVVPVAVEGTHSIWPRSRRCPRLRGRIDVRIAPALAAEDVLAGGTEAAVARIRDTIAAMQAELRAARVRTDRRASRSRGPGPP